MTFKQDERETPVLFRADRSGDFKGTVTAVFPCEPADTAGRFISCYAHVGQHGSCSLDWYRGTRPATSDEYADLKQELESAPYGYRLKVCRRMTPAHREEFRKALSRA